MNAKGVDDDSIGTEEGAGTSRKRVTRELSEFRSDERLTEAKVIILPNALLLSLEVRLTRVYLTMTIVILLQRRKPQRKRKLRRENQRATTKVISASKKKDTLSSQSEN